MYLSSAIGNPIATESFSIGVYSAASVIWCVVVPASGNSRSPLPITLSDFPRL